MPHIEHERFVVAVAGVLTYEPAAQLVSGSQSLLLVRVPGVRRYSDAVQAVCGVHAVTSAVVLNVPAAQSMHTRSTVGEPAVET